jgi:rhamnosyltransferase
MESNLLMNADISVIIPTLSAEKSIKSLIEALNNQTYKPREIIVVDSSSEDNTATVAKTAGARVINIPRSEFNHGSTRTLGGQHAMGNVLIFMTQDALPANSRTLEMLVQPIANGSSVAAYARQIPYANANPIEKFWRYYNYPNQSITKDSTSKCRKYFFSNVCSAFDKKFFDKVGGFEPAEICEDVLMSYQLINAGYRVAYQAEALVFHSHNDSLRSKSRRYYLIGRFNSRFPHITQGSCNEKDGMVTVLRLVKSLTSSRHFGYVGIAIIDMFCRYVSYKTGWLGARFYR